MSTRMSTSQVSAVWTWRLARRRRDRQSGQGRRSQGARRVERRTLTARSYADGHNGIGRPSGPAWKRLFPLLALLQSRRKSPGPTNGPLRTASASVCIHLWTVGREVLGVFGWRSIVGRRAVSECSIDPVVTHAGSSQRLPELASHQLSAVRACHRPGSERGQASSE
jgi:hypothetical protein